MKFVILSLFILASVSTAFSKPIGNAIKHKHMKEVVLTKTLKDMTRNEIDPILKTPFDLLDKYEDILMKSVNPSILKKFLISLSSINQPGDKEIYVWEKFINTTNDRLEKVRNQLFRERKFKELIKVELNRFALMRAARPNYYKVIRFAYLYKRYWKNGTNSFIPASDHVEDIFIELNKLVENLQAIEDKLTQQDNIRMAAMADLFKLTVKNEIKSVLKTTFDQLNRYEKKKNLNFLSNRQ